MISVDEFKQREFKEINEDYQTKGTIAALIGIPTLTTTVTAAVATGSAIGAGFAGIGILSGALIGGVLAAALALAVLGWVSASFFPRAANAILSGMRRLTKGSFHYRYLTEVVNAKTNLHVDKMIEIAKQLKVLQQYSLMSNDNEKNFMKGLSKKQKQLFTEIKWVVDHSTTEEHINYNIARNETIYHFKKALWDDYFKKERQHRLWAVEQIHVMPHDVRARVEMQGMGPGKSPFAMPRYLLKKLHLRKLGGVILPKRPKSTAKKTQAFISSFPEIAFYNGDHLILGLLECSMDEIKNYAKEVHDKLLNYNSLPKSKLDEAIEELNEKIAAIQPDATPGGSLSAMASADRQELKFANKQRDFLEAHRDSIGRWFNKPRRTFSKSVTKMNEDELNTFLQRLKHKRKFSRHKDYYRARINRLEAYIKEQHKQPVQTMDLHSP